MAGGRGPTWRRGEILDLLDIWGEEKVQASLRESHRNLDVFEEVAEKMQGRGHRKTAEECRNKTKSLRLAYKRVIAHNQKTGNDPTTCPFFDELDKILHGDPSVKTRRVSQSLTRKTTDRNAAVEEGTLDLFPFNTEERRLEDTEGTSYDESVSGDGRSTETRQDTDSDMTMIGDSTAGGEEARPQSTEVPDNRKVADTRERNPDEIPPDVPLSELSPSSRLALKRRRRERVSAMQRVGDMVLRQSSREHREMIETIGGASKDILSELRQTRDMETRKADNMYSLFERAIGVFETMPQRLKEVVDIRPAPMSHPRMMESNRPSFSGSSTQGWSSVQNSEPYTWMGLGNSQSHYGEFHQEHNPTFEGWVDYHGVTSDNYQNQGHCSRQPSTIRPPSVDLFNPLPMPGPQNSNVSSNMVAEDPQPPKENQNRKGKAPTTPTREKSKRNIKKKNVYSPSD